jgi:hypothetical protein
MHLIFAQLSWANFYFSVQSSLHHTHPNQQPTVTNMRDAMLLSLRTAKRASSNAFAITSGRRNKVTLASDTFDIF